MHGSPEEPSAEILPLCAAERPDEASQLDDALAGATDSMLRSLEAEDRRRNQRWLLALGVMILAVPTILVVVMFSNPQWFEDTPLPAPQTQASRPQVKKSIPTRTAEQRPVRIVNVAGAPIPSGEFTMHLPRGFEWPVTLRALSKTEYKFTSPKGLNSMGIYEFQGDLLVMKKPVDKRLTEFQWKIVDRNNLVLVAEPPAAKTGATYLGTKLIRN